ncbi:hypothetical protein DESA109040_02425 [Deinococcus saxicola]|uniref:hypothetical protein n=1 Tax=Deinococcus saxicola TaxID=249406 RepID=UPI0039EE6B07
MKISEQDALQILHPERRDPEVERRRLETLARAEHLGRLLGPLTTERLRAGIPLPRPQHAHD